MLLREHDNRGDLRPADLTLSALNKFYEYFRMICMRAGEVAYTVSYVKRISMLYTAVIR